MVPNDGGRMKDRRRSVGGVDPLMLFDCYCRFDTP
jgi:hypothetical protein